ncbi:SusC/RagA family TonB-linked outer membrane protein [Fulvivirga ligni]|uniref:SusC/RagA family TonB-linked outer membrane protein n=1 Tax=Fulvivirga ligni TaxID=2904246 RepID=UPI001F452742|nr:TonB-dependent receptor [Fulvivirga ligni]UII19553.1 TonB-dependent receptor [Fulvivirga ligni]
MKKIILLLIIAFTAQLSYAQEMVVRGKVTSDDGESLPGVNIIKKGTNTGMSTDVDGNYMLKANKGDVLIFSFIGFKTKEIQIGDQQQLNVVLSMDLTSLEEVIVVGYGEVKRITNTGSVSAISAKDVQTVPTPNIQNTLSGRMPGFFSQQRSGQPGRDASDFFIRGVSSLNAEGNRPLIIVDDVQYTYDQLQQINVNEIESISILKDASTTAIYGIKGANGVLVIKTRRGKEGKPKINFRVEGGVQTPVRTPEFLDSYNTALLVNEAYENDGLQPIFTEEDLELFKNGEDPYGHPNVNWYDEIFKKYATQQNMNLDVSGGTDRLKYFISGGAFAQNGLVKDFSDPFNEVNNNYFYRRFNFRTNLDFDVTKSLKMRLDVTSRFGNINEPYNQNAIGEIYNFAQIRPYSAPLYNPNGSYAYAFDTEGKLPTLNARLANGGYRRTRRTDTNVLFGLSQDLSDLVEGLSVSARIAYSSIEENSKSLFRSGFPSYHYDSENSTYTIHPSKQYKFDGYTSLGDIGVFTKNVNIQGFLNYDKQINDDHTIKALLFYNRQSNTVDKDGFTSANVPQNFVGYTGKLSYNYRNKYLIDLNGAYNGSDRFGEDNRYGFFPAVGLGWTISEENFFSVPFVQLLKLRTSYGLVGSDATSGNRYLFNQVYSPGGGYFFGTATTGYPTIYEGDLGNPNVVWEKARKFDVGLDMNLFKNKLTLTVDYFYDFRYDQLVPRGSVPNIIGIGTSPTNIAETVNRGFDGKLGYETNITKDLFFNTSLVFSIAKNKVIYKDEAQPAFPWLAETGHPINQPFGYTWVGYYSEEDIARNNDENPDNDVPVPLNDTEIQAGDLKYKDLSGDGIINDLDKSAIGKPNLPNTTLGLSTGFSYKGLSINVLFQGSFNYSFSVVGTGIEPFKSQFQPIHQQRWTPENADNAEFPRLTSNPTTVNSSSAYMSDFWLVDAWYIRLKTVDIGYVLPQKFLPGNIENARVYLSGYNLLTKTSYDKYQQDPEISTNTAGDAYLNQRVVNLGIQIGF